MYMNSTHTHHTLNNSATAVCADYIHCKNTIYIQQNSRSTSKWEKLTMEQRSSLHVINQMLALSTYQTWQNLFSMTHSLSCSAFALHCKSRIALEPQEGHTHSVLLQNPTAHCFSFRFMLLFLGFSCLPSSIHSASRTNIVEQNGAYYLVFTAQLGEV